jgi:hypothetical protein
LRRIVASIAALSAVTNFSSGSTLDMPDFLLHQWQRRTLIFGACKKGEI